MNKKSEHGYKVTTEIDVTEVPRRVAFIKRETTVAVQDKDELVVTSFPHLVVRGAIAFQLLVVVLAIAALIFDAPLKHIADPFHTEIPAKAPWYFLGLQELLHYFSPVVAGVLIPGLIIVALIVIPYMEVNIEFERLWERQRRQRFLILSLAALSITVSMPFFHAWAISIPTIILYLLAIMPLFIKSKKRFIHSLRKMTIANWVMTWFVVQAIVLTVIGVFFRGPYWHWSWPWIEGIY